MLDDISPDALAWAESDLAIPHPASPPAPPAPEAVPARRADDARQVDRRGGGGDVSAPPKSAPPESTPPEPALLGALDVEGPVCLAFRGVGGGAGTTSLAVGVAQSLASRAGGRRVCLVDLDVELGTVASYLDVEPGARVADFTVDPARVDRTFVRALLCEHPGGVSVLAVEPEAGAVDPATLLAVLDVLSDMFPILVLDVPRAREPWTDAVLRAADRAVLVGELHIPALHRARGQLDALRAAGVRADMVLCKYERRSFKASLRRADAEKALARPVLGVVATDPHTAAECVNCGEPVGRLVPEGRLAKDVDAVAEALVAARADTRRARRRRG